jgi:hypothetical protein
VVHHADYLNDRDDQALCGVTFSDSTAATEPDTADALCPDCEARLVVYHLEWWRERALAATAELEALHAEYRELEERVGLQPVAPAPREVDDAQRRDPFAADADADADADETTFLAQARRELTELCRQFDGAVPYWRLKNTMQDFNDRLETHERVLLAKEIGADGSLIRWATTRVETLGWQVTNSPVHENSEMMWEEWLQESHQVSKKTKRRFGRSK